MTHRYPAIWLLSIALIAAGPAAGQAISDTRDNHPELLKQLEEAAGKADSYRAEIDALIRGTPDFRQSQSTLSLPGDPLANLPPGEVGNPASGRNQSTLMVFLTLSMPDDALAGWLDQTARAGGIAVVRGLHGDKLSVTLERLTALQEKAPATRHRGGVSIDPSAFNRFDVSVAPTVIVSAAALPPCTSRGCAEDPAPVHDRIAGNITLGHALKLIEAEGDAAPHLARRHLDMLEKGD